MGVGRLLRVGGLDGVQGRVCLNNALASTEQTVRLKEIIALTEVEIC